MTGPVTPMKYHVPGWSMEFEEGKHTISYMVWAPQTQADVDSYGSSNPPREYWAANYQKGIVSDDDYEDVDGNHTQGASFDAVTAHFPTEIKEAFQAALKGGEK